VRDLNREQFISKTESHSLLRTFIASGPDDEDKLRVTEKISHEHE